MFLVGVGANGTKIVRLLRRFFRIDPAFVVCPNVEGGAADMPVLGSASARVGVLPGARL